MPTDLVDLEPVVDAPSECAGEPPFQNVNRQMARMMEQMTKGYYNFRPSETWAPNVNLYETEGEYLVCVDLAGVDKEKLDLEVADSRLSIRGSREVPSFDAPPPAGTEQRRIRVHVMEIDHGPFHREVELPQNVEKERIVATYRNGMLWVELPKR